MAKVPLKWHTEQRRNDFMAKGKQDDIKMHQNVLVFYKGDPKKIKEEFPKIKVEEYLQELNYQPNIALSVIDD